MYDYSIVACARWEEHDIVEWVEYHRSIGFDHIFLYSNDDDPYVLFKVLQPYILGDSPFITYKHWPHPGQQIQMYLDFLRTNLKKTKWLSFIDVDEFITLRKHRSIGQFLYSLGSVDCVYLNWLNYGTSGYKERSQSSVLLSHDRREAHINYHTKTIIRSSVVDPDDIYEGLVNGGAPFTHYWTGYKLNTTRIMDVMGRDASQIGADFPNSAIEAVRRADVSDHIIDKAYIAHFQFKSEADFLRRVARGGFVSQSHWGDVHEGGRHHEMIDRANAVEDRFLADYWLDHIGRSLRLRGSELQHITSSEPRAVAGPVTLAITHVAADPAVADSNKEHNMELAEMDGFQVKLDREKYDPIIVGALLNGGYEYLERHLMGQVLQPGDKLIEAGTAIGAVSLTASRIIGPENVVTFEANPEIYEDACGNLERNGMGAVRAINGVLQNRLVARAGVETLEFGISSSFIASRLNAEPDAPDIVRRVPVQVYVFEHEVAKHGANTLACDIEGAEVDLLLDADLTGINKVILEIHRGLAGEDRTNQLIKRLINDNFKPQFAMCTDEILVMVR